MKKLWVQRGPQLANGRVHTEVQVDSIVGTSHPFVLQRDPYVLSPAAS